MQGIIGPGRSARFPIFTGRRWALGYRRVGGRRGSHSRQQSFYYVATYTYVSSAPVIVSNRLVQRCSTFPSQRALLWAHPTFVWMPLFKKAHFWVAFLKLSSWCKSLDERIEFRLAGNYLFTDLVTEKQVEEARRIFEEIIGDDIVHFIRKNYRHFEIVQIPSSRSYI